MAYVATFDRRNWFALRERDTAQLAVDSYSSDEGVISSEHEMELANEFATVRIRKIHTRNGERLEISSPKFGYSIRLDPVELESLTWQSSDVFSAFLSTPFAPKVVSD